MMISGFLPASHKPDAVRMICAPPRPAARPIPQLRNNATPRPEGRLPPLRIEIRSDAPRASEIANGVRADPYNDALLAQIIGAQDRSIRLTIDCAGGRSRSALAICSALLVHPWRVTARIVGRCSSSAPIIAVCADRRTIASDAKVLIHGTRRFFSARDYAALFRRPAKERDAIGETMMATDDVLAAILAARTGKTFAEAHGWLIEDREWSASEAVANGIAHSIIGENPWSQ